MRREPTSLKPKYLRFGNKAWRLKMTSRRRPDLTVTDARGGSGRHLAKKNACDPFAGVRILPREAKLLPYYRVEEE